MHSLDKWKPLIDGVRSENDLLAVIHDYCASWLPSELAMLPAVCQECAAESGDELAGLAVDFKRADLSFTGSEEAHALLRQMALVFSHAAERLRVFRQPATSPKPRE